MGSSGKCPEIRQILDQILALPPASCGARKIHAVSLNLSFSVGRKWAERDLRADSIRSCASDTGSPSYADIGRVF